MAMVEVLCADCGYTYPPRAKPLKCTQCGGPIRIEPLEPDWRKEYQPAEYNPEYWESEDGWGI